MKKLLACLLMLALCLTCAVAEEYRRADGYVWMEENGLYGLSDADGQVILPCVYGQEIVVLEEIGCLYVLYEGQWGLLDLEGNAVIVPEWDALYSIDKGRTLWRAFRGEMVEDWRNGFKVPGEGLWALYSADGTEISPLQWTEIGSLTDGLMIVEKDGLMGAMNAQGEIVIRVEWTRLHAPVNGLLCARKDGLWCVLDTAGGVILPPTACDGMYVRQDGFIEARSEESWSALYDAQGRLITQERYAYICDFSGGLAAVSRQDGSGMGYIDQQGVERIPCVWAYAENFVAVTEGETPAMYAIVMQNGLYGVIDQTGELVVPCEWEKLEWLGDGRLEGTKTTVIDLTE